MGGNEFRFNEIFVKIPKIPHLISAFFSHSAVKTQFYHSCTILSVLYKVRLLPLVFLFLLSAAIFSYCSNQVCLCFSFSFRLFASLLLFFFSLYLFFIFYLFFMNCLLVIHESDIQCFCTPKYQNKLAICTPKNLEMKRNEKCCQSYMYN